GCVDEDARGRDIAPPAHVEHEAPRRATLRANAARARTNVGAALARVERVEHDQARIVRPTVRIFESMRISLLERRSENPMSEIDAAGCGQNAAAAEMIIDEEAQPQHPERAHS